MADLGVVKEYVTDLHHLLSNSELAKRKSFIRSFVKEVKVTGEEVLITYKLPMLPKGVLEEKLSVLPTGHVGGDKVSIGRTEKTATATVLRRLKAARPSFTLTSTTRKT